jgi:hypothetical protein
MSLPLYVIVWTCVVLFVVTGVITLLALVGRVTLGGNRTAHEYYLKILFRTLVVELIVISLTAFGGAIRNNNQDTNALNDSVTDTLQALETRVRRLEKFHPGP